MINDDFSTVVLNKQELALLKRLKRHDVPYSDTAEINALIKYHMATDKRALSSDGEGGFNQDPDGIVSISERGLAFLAYRKKMFAENYLFNIISMIISFLVLVVSVTNLIINLIFNVTKK